MGSHAMMQAPVQLPFGYLMFRVLFRALSVVQQIVSITYFTENVSRGNGGICGLMPLVLSFFVSGLVCARAAWTCASAACGLLPLRKHSRPLAFLLAIPFGWGQGVVIAMACQEYLQNWLDPLENDLLGDDAYASPHSPSQRPGDDPFDTGSPRICIAIEVPEVEAPQGQQRGAFGGASSTAPVTQPSDAHLQVPSTRNHVSIRRRIARRIPRHWKRHRIRGEPGQFHCEVVDGLLQGFAFGTVLAFEYWSLDYPMRAPITTRSASFLMMPTDVFLLLMTIVSWLAASSTILELDHVASDAVKKRMREHMWYPLIHTVFRLVEISMRVWLHVVGMVLIYAQAGFLWSWAPSCISFVFTLGIIVWYGGIERSSWSILVQLGISLLCVISDLFCFVDHPQERRASRRISFALTIRNMVELLTLPASILICVYSDVSKLTSHTEDLIEFFGVRHHISWAFFLLSAVLYLILRLSLLRCMPKPYWDLYEACTRGDYETAQRALGAPSGPDIDRADADGFTPLMLAAIQGNSDICLLLLFHDARVDARLPLRKGMCGACFRRNNGATPNLRWTAAHMCAHLGSSGHAQILRHLLRKGGLDAHLADERGDTPLHVAARCHHADFIQVVKDDWPFHWFELRNKAGKRPEDLAGGVTRVILQSIAAVVDARRMTSCSVNRLPSSPEMTPQSPNISHKEASSRAPFLLPPSSCTGSSMQRTSSGTGCSLPRVHSGGGCTPSADPRSAVSVPASWSSPLPLPRGENPQWTRVRSTKVRVYGSGSQAPQQVQGVCSFLISRGSAALGELLQGPLSCVAESAPSHVDTTIHPVSIPSHQSDPNSFRPNRHDDEGSDPEGAFGLQLEDLEPCDRRTGDALPNDGHVALAAWRRPPVESFIGGGSFGKVYRAKERMEDGPGMFAVKRIEKRFGGAANGAIDRENEVSECIRQRPHPCIVQVYDVIDVRQWNLLFIAMEFCPGPKLEIGCDLYHAVVHYARTSVSGVVPPFQAKQWFAEVFLGLEHLHVKMRALLRDLKHQNVVLDRNGQAKLADFGLGRLDIYAPNAEWTFGTPPGSPGWAAPEIFQNKAYNYQCDFYSLGVLLWILLTGGVNGNGHPPAGQYGGNYHRHEMDYLLLRECLERPRDSHARPIPRGPARDLVRMLTSENFERRGKHRDVREHPFMEGVFALNTGSGEGQQLVSNASYEEVVEWVRMRRAGQDWSGSAL